MSAKTKLKTPDISYLTHLKGISASPFHHFTKSQNEDPMKIGLLNPQTSNAKKD